MPGMSNFDKWLTTDPRESDQIAWETWLESDEAYETFFTWMRDDLPFQELQPLFDKYVQTEEARRAYQTWEASFEPEYEEPDRNEDA